ncbi:MAG: Gfo/Idh/MocA family oxidoreductase [Pseudomonadota bacterium]
MIRTVAIVGAGIGAEHLAAYVKLPDRYKVLCLCDLNADRAKAVVEPYGIEVETDLNVVLGSADIDIIDVCLPPHLHVPVSLSVLDAGKAVICEKPLSTSLHEVDMLARKMEEKGGAVFPVFQYRYGLGTAQLAALMDAGLAGECYAGSLETHWDRGSDYYGVAWRGTWKGEQGGALLSHAIHIHDLLTSLVGPVARVYAETATRVNNIETEDCAALSMRMASGAVITSSVTLGAAGNTSRLRLMFEGFTVESDHAAYSPATESWKFTARYRSKQPVIDQVLSTVAPQPSGFLAMLIAISEHLDGRVANPVLLDDGRRSIEFVTAAYHSARTLQPVSLPLNVDHPLYAGWLPTDV